MPDFQLVDNKFRISYRHNITYTRYIYNNDVNAGCLHPEHDGYFSSPAEYMKWYKQHGPLGCDPTHPTVAVLLYRKHVITEQMYIGQLIINMEEQGVRPIPIFINGIEAHTVVRLLAPLPAISFLSIDDASHNGNFLQESVSC